jgi:uncharacterized damage-inducible protein DinB
MHSHAPIQRPDPGELPAHGRAYVDALPSSSLDDALALVETELESLVSTLDDTGATLRYSSGKWSIKELISHLTECERVLALRALWLARSPGAELPGFDEDSWVARSAADTRTLADLLTEHRSVRAATRTLLAAIPEAHLDCQGTADGHPITTRALLWMIAGHQHHHTRVLRERYGLEG